MLKLLIYLVGLHVLVEALLVRLNTWSDVALGEDVAYMWGLEGLRQSQGELSSDIRSTNSSFSGRFSKCFRRLSEACWRSSSSCLACRDLKRGTYQHTATEGQGHYLRRSIGVEKDMTILEILYLRTVL